MGTVGAIKNIEPANTKASAIDAGSIIAGITAGLSFLALIASCFKGKAKRKYKASKVTRQQELKFEHMVNTEKGTHCRCGSSHQTKLHAVGKSETLAKLFPGNTNTHLHKGLTFMCLIAGCSSEILVPLPTTAVMNVQNITIKHLQFDFFNPPLTSDNYFHNNGYVSDVDNIAIEIKWCWFEGYKPVTVLRDIRQIDQYFRNITIANQENKLHGISFHIINQNKTEICTQNVSYWPKMWKNLNNRLQIEQREIVDQIFWCVLKESLEKVTKIQIPKYPILQIFPCVNSDLVVSFVSGQKFVIENANQNNTMLAYLIASQGLEVTLDLSSCKTKRCVAVPKTKSQRQTRSVNCGGFFLWMYCPNAVSYSNLKDVLKHYSEKQTKLLKKTTVITGKQVYRLSEAIRNTQVMLKDQLSNYTQLINKKFNTLTYQLTYHGQLRKFRKEIIDTRIAMAEVRDNLMTAIISQRLSAVECINNYRFSIETLWNAIDCIDGKCDKLHSSLATLDMELISLKKAEYPININVYLSDSISIIYSKPQGYQLKVVHLPHKPKIDIASDCKEGICSQCVTQLAATPKIKYSKPLNDLQGITQARISPFQINKCTYKGQPEFNILQVGTVCLKVTIEQTIEIQCPKSVNITDIGTRIFSMDITPNIEFIDNFQKPLDLFIKPNEHWLTENILNTEHLSLEIKRDFENTVHFLDETLMKLESQTPQIKDDIDWGYYMSILNFLISACIAIGLLTQFVYLKALIKKSPKPGIKYHGTSRPNTSLIIDNYRPPSHYLKTYKIVKDNDIYHMECHAGSNWSLAIEMGMGQLNTPDGKININITEAQMIDCQPCSCNALGLIIIKDKLYPILNTW